MADGSSASKLRVAAVSLDCADPVVLADFYRELLDGEEQWRTQRSVAVKVPGALLIMERVDGYRPPTWPGTVVMHLDLTAGSELDGPARRALELGATLAELQPDHRWRVLIDPAGHPFCITTLAPPG